MVCVDDSTAAMDVKTWAVPVPAALMRRRPSVKVRFQELGVTGSDANSDNERDGNCIQDGEGMAAVAWQIPSVPSHVNASPFRYVVPLGSQCYLANLLNSEGLLRFNLPFDRIFSSAAMVRHCMEDNFSTFLDKSKYFAIGKMHVSVALRPGEFPQERTLVGHRTYLPMGGGIARGAVFVHHDPMSCDEDYEHFKRCVDRFQRLLCSPERKLFILVSLFGKIWRGSELRLLWRLLWQRTDNFLLLAVNCVRNQGALARTKKIHVVDQKCDGDRGLLVLDMYCVGENCGSFFFDAIDTQRMHSNLISPYTFNLTEELPLAQAATATIGGGSSPDQDQNDLKSRWQQPQRRGRGKGSSCPPPSQCSPTALDKVAMRGHQSPQRSWPNHRRGRFPPECGRGRDGCGGRRMVGPVSLLPGVSGGPLGAVAWKAAAAVACGAARPPYRTPYAATLSSTSCPLGQLQQKQDSDEVCADPFGRIADVGETATAYSPPHSAQPLDSELGSLGDDRTLLGGDCITEVRSREGLVSGGAGAAEPYP